MYGTATTTKGQPPVATTCLPENGTLFPVGETTVTCTAIDATRRASSCTFLVTVTAPPQLSVTRFVAFGDSITFGEDGQNSLLPWIHQTIRLPPSQQYPGVLKVELAARYTAQSPDVYNAGKQGESVTELTIPTTPQRLSNLLAGGQYDVLLLMEGTNDLNDRDDSIEPAVIATLQRMLRDAKGRGVRPYLATIPPENPHGFRGLASSLVPGFNDRIRTLAMSERVPLVDVYQALNTDINTFIGFDGLHPTVAGQAKIADLFFAAIEQTLEAPAPSSLLSGRPASSATPAAAARNLRRSRLRAR
jgi:lysophospholipase L1-like esterase